MNVWPLERVLFLNMCLLSCTISKLQATRALKRAVALAVGNLPIEEPTTASALNPIDTLIYRHVIFRAYNKYAHTFNPAPAPISATWSQPTHIQPYTRRFDLTRLQPSLQSEHTPPTISILLPSCPHQSPTTHHAIDIFNSSTYVVITNSIGPIHR